MAIPLELENKARKILDGHRLDVDRGKTSSRLTKSLETWRKDTGRYDLAGFDDKSRQQKSKREVGRATLGTLEYLEAEVPRLFDDYLSGRAEDMTDLATTRRVIEEEVSGNSLSNIPWNRFPTLAENVFDLAITRGYVGAKHKEHIIHALMKSQSIDRWRAEEVFADNYRNPAWLKKMLG